MFQSRAGFSPCLDARSFTVGVDREGGVSIPCWVFSLSRRPRRRRCGGCGVVSIPCWVFSLSRRERHRKREGLRILFQSRAGFSPCLDTWRGRRPSRAACFNPVLGFLPVSTQRIHRKAPTQKMFQSRAGFSPCLDHVRLVHKKLLQPVSIPCWVFSLSRPRSRLSPSQSISCFNPVLGFLPVSTPRGWPARAFGPPCFNPVLGFLPVSTESCGSPTPSSSGFNPVLGFLPVSTRRSVWRRRGRPREVSIPCWVFSLSRPSSSTDWIRASQVSIPCWVFSLSRLSPPGGGALSIWTSFNPVLGFLPVSTS